MVLPLLAAEGLGLVGNVVGGILQGKAAKKAAGIQAAGQEKAMLARQQAASKVEQLQRPGVVAWQNGLNALSGRLGLPTQGISDAIADTGQKTAFDEQAYLAANPDVAAEYAKTNGWDGRGAIWHYQQYGQFENRPGAPQPIAAANGGSTYVDPFVGPGGAAPGAPRAMPVGATPIAPQAAPAAGPYAESPMYGAARPVAANNALRGAY